MSVRYPTLAEPKPPKPKWVNLRPTFRQVTFRRDDCLSDDEMPIGMDGWWILRDNARPQLVCGFENALEAVREEVRRCA